MRIQHNIQALNTHRQYGINNAQNAQSAEKLYSGFRINRAGDDAAGLAISEKMRAQIRGLTMASKNSQDAISLVQTAEGALQESHNILQRMRELAVQSASDTNETQIDRGALNQEFEQLKKEISDIASKTTFNDQKLIDGTFREKIYYQGASSTIPGDVIPFNNIKTGLYTLNVYQRTEGASAGQLPEVKNIIASGSNMGDVEFELDANAAAMSTDQFNGTWELKYIGDGQFKLWCGDREYTATVDSATKVDGVDAGSDFILTFTDFGTLTIPMNTTMSPKGFDQIENIKVQIGEGQNVSDGTPRFYAKLGDRPEVEILNGTKELNFIDMHISMTTPITFDKADTDAAFTVISFAVQIEARDGKALIIQTGANMGDEMRLSLCKMDAKSLGVEYHDVSTRESASRAIDGVNRAVNMISSMRADLGAMQNRLTYKISNLDTSAENLQAAESRIRDVDMAKEMIAFNKANILSQASTAMLAQANQLPQNVLQLLQ